MFVGFLMACIGACAAAMRAPVAHISPEGGDLVSQTHAADVGSLDIPFTLTQLPTRPATLELLFGVTEMARG
jgi:hypothetical protein